MSRGHLRPVRALLSLALALCFLCGGCFTPRAVPGPIPGSPLTPELTSSLQPYLIHPGDELEIRFFHTPDQNVTLPVRPDGMISLPLAYELQAAGRTPEDLRQELLRRYAQELSSPEIAVIVRTFASYQVHVGGEVDRPQVLELTGEYTVLEAVFAAGGFLPTASLADVLVVRRTASRGYEIVPADMESVLAGLDARGNLLLQPYDVVYVPPSRVADVNKWVEQYIRQNIPITFSYRLEP
jgi:polysaccharide export outer membrane protein